MIWLEFTLLACLPLVSYLLAQAIGEIDQLQDKVREQNGWIAESVQREANYVYALWDITALATDNMAHIGKRMVKIAQNALPR